MESVYGDRNHETRGERKDKLKDFIKRTIEKRRFLLSPLFLLERTQAILHEMNDIFENGELPSLPVFIDSPLATKVTEIYKKYAMDDFNEEVKAEIRGGDDAFDFPTPKIYRENGGFNRYRKNTKSQDYYCRLRNVSRRENCSTRKESFV